MKTALYIRSAVAISAQHSFEPEKFLNPICQTDTGKLFALDVPFQEYIPPVPIRRMSRILKMAISAAIEAVRQAEISRPDAIITGTGRGSVGDMQEFVKDLIRLEEGALNPTLFIQSTYNSPNGWIAMLTSCREYNQTFVHRGCSFELALLDAQLFAAESEHAVNVLVGAFDDLTHEYFAIRSKRGYWKMPPPVNTSLFAHMDTPGSLAGQGANFFVLSTDDTEASARIDAVDIVYKAAPERIREAVEAVLKDAGLEARDISLVITGLSGDSLRNDLYAPSLELFSGIPVGVFKHFSGEYETASAFGLWLANFILKSDKLPVELFLYNPVSNVSGPILLINDYIQGTASIMLISPCL